MVIDADSGNILGVPEADGLGGVVDDDLPAFVSFFEDKGEEAFGVAAVFFAAFELIFADADGETVIEGVDFEIGEGEGSHSGFGGVVVAVLLDEAGVAAGDLAGEEDGVGGVFVALGEAFDVAAVPGGLLGEEDFDDAELLRCGGVEGIGSLGVGEGGAGEHSRAEEQVEEAADELVERHGRPRRGDGVRCSLKLLL
jgi:hypothetical protein